MVRASSRQEHQHSAAEQLERRRLGHGVRRDVVDFHLALAALKPAPQRSRKCDIRGDNSEEPRCRNVERTYRWGETHRGANTRRKGDIETDRSRSWWKRGQHSAAHRRLKMIDDDGALRDHLCKEAEDDAVLRDGAAEPDPLTGLRVINGVLKPSYSEIVRGSPSKADGAIRRRRKPNASTA